MTITKAFGATTVAFTKSMQEIDRLLGAHGITESRFTHIRPKRAMQTSRDAADETFGAVTYEFVRGGQERRGVRVTVKYRPDVGPNGGKAGSTPEMAGRAMYWFLKAKFDSIDYGIEEFDAAFMPHLLTAFGTTFAEQPLLISEIIHKPESVLAIAPPRITVKELSDGR